MGSFSLWEKVRMREEERASLLNSLTLALSRRERELRPPTPEVEPNSVGPCNRNKKVLEGESRYGDQPTTHDSHDVPYELSSYTVWHAGGRRERETSGRAG